MKTVSKTHIGLLRTVSAGEGNEGMWGSVRVATSDK